ncbi:MAG: ABC transporter ATP-binding protein [Patescibacteria group bacterium]
MVDAVVEALELYRTFQVGETQVRALNGISLAVPRAALTIIRGRSGSGKTTLLNIIGGLDRPTSGRVLVCGRNVHSLTGAELTAWRRREVGFVFQSFALMPHLTALENVELPLRIQGVSWRKRRARAQECLRQVGLVKRAHHRAVELSGGEQQRVGIARALSCRPSLILADEPTGELDFETGMRVMGLFREIVDREGISVCVATHDPAAGEYGDLEFLLEDGRLAGEV